MEFGTAVLGGRLAAFIRKEESLNVPKGNASISPAQTAENGTFSDSV